jgi:hypothetical protein
MGGAAFRVDLDLLDAANDRLGLTLKDADWASSSRGQNFRSRLRSSTGPRTD